MRVGLKGTPKGNHDPTQIEGQWPRIEAREMSFMPEKMTLEDHMRKIIGGEMVDILCTLAQEVEDFHTKEQIQSAMSKNEHQTRE